ncbi:MAG: hypothetical protein QM754_01540 [Tepidisphaeraceae bacterium]
MVDAPQTPTTTAASSTEADLQKLSHLHRMSRTAGLGSSEYSAVNIAAVVAVLIGLASALALLSPVFLFLPVVGVIIAAVAVKQVISSNGTQTGLPLAVLALLLCFGLSAFTGLKAFRAGSQEKQDNADLVALVDQFSKSVLDKKYADAYKLTDARFQEQVNLATFETAFDGLINAPSLGALQGIRTNKIFQIDSDPETGLRMAVGYIFIDFEKRHGDDAVRTEARYRNSNDEWKIFSIPQLFPAKAAAPGNQPPAGAAGPAAPGR